MMQEILSPRVQDGRETDLRAQVLGVRSDGEQGLGSGAKKNVVHHRLILQGYRSKRFGQCKDGVMVRDGEDFRLARFEPLRLVQALAFGAVAIAARIVGDGLMATVVAFVDVSAQRRRAAHLDGVHDTALFPRHAGAIFLAIDVPVRTENVRHFQ